jgi:hypothetical protein
MMMLRSPKLCFLAAVVMMAIRTPSINASRSSADTISADLTAVLELAAVDAPAVADATLEILIFEPPEKLDAL